jgi:uncharacterized protein (TIGR02270 family)
MSSVTPPQTSGPFLWDVLEEHFQEAAFLWMQRERSLLAPDQSLSDVSEGDEYRLVAHLEGLLHAGARAARKLLIPALREGLPGEVSVAALVLLSSDGEDWTAEVLDALPETEHPAALLAGLSLSPRATMESALRARFPALAPSLQALVLEALALRRVDPGALLDSARTTDEPTLLKAALRAARFSRGPTLAELLARGLSHGDPGARDEALATGCIFGHRESWLRCRRVVEQAEPLPFQALVALAMGGEAKELQLLEARLSRPESRAEVLEALGLGGRPASIETLLALLRQDEPAAAQPLALVSGLPLSSLWVPSEQEPEDAAPEGVPAGGTVLLAAIEAWWAHARPRLPAEGRYLVGRPWSLETLLTALDVAPGPCRPSLAWELAVRTKGALQVETRAWSWTQRELLGTAVRLAPRFQSGPFVRFMST